MDDAQFKSKYVDSWPLTPLQKIGGVWLKREDHNITGSVKSRGMVWQIHHMLQNKQQQIVISSSGNASIAAAYYCNMVGITLHAFVPPFIEPMRLEKLLEYGAVIHQQEMAIEGAMEFATSHELPYLRQSKDDYATKGYQNLWFELQKQFQDQGINPKEVSLFFPVSSGTTVQGVWEGIQQSGILPENMPQIHVVQSQSIHPIASSFDTDFRRKARSIVTGVVARDTDRKDTVIRAVRATHGFGWVVQDDQVVEATDILDKRGVTGFSREGALAYAGYEKARTKGYRINAHIVVMLT